MSKQPRHATPLPASLLPARPPSDLHRALHAMRGDLFGRALRLSRNPDLAEDLVQDTMVRALRFESSFIAGTNARAWVFQVLFSVFITHCRRRRREVRGLEYLSCDPCAWTLPDRAPVMRALSSGLEQKLDLLPEGFRDAVVLVDLQELSYRDAADRIGVPVGTVMSRLHRGRKMLARSLSEDTPLAA